MSSSELVNYQVQLQQVEAALITDPHNADLSKLKSDLEEAIRLTKSLMGINDNNVCDLNGTQTLTQNFEHKFQAGDPCMAPWSEDGQFYEAVIEDLTSDGQCNVVFNYLPNGKFRVSEVCLISMLKSSTSQRKKNKQSYDASGSQKKIDPQMNREMLKKRQQKKQSRFKEIEEAREKDKNKWKQFNQKAINKNLKGAVSLAKKQSIFKSPDTVEGKVGVGTCGISGKPMTNFTVGDKYKRGTLSSVGKGLSAMGFQFNSSTSYSMYKKN